MTVLIAAPDTIPAAAAWHWPERAVLRAYLLYAGATGMLFFLGYGGANWLAATRAEHYRLFFDAELAIPLIPEALWVYLSINLLFLLPLFRLDRDEMVWLGRRMIAGTVVAVTIFLAWPTTLGFARLDVADGAHPAFGLLYALDLPFNCAPSLHVVYSALIVAAVGRRAGTALRLALGVWLLLIIASTLLTHQHHLIDAVSALFLVALLGAFGRKEARMTATEIIGKRAKPRWPLYLASPADTLALTEEAEALLDRHGPAAPHDLLARAGTDRPDLATMLLYRACHRGANGAFLEAASRLSAGLAPLATPIRLLIVPGFLFAEHPELAIDGALIRDIALRLGADAEVVPIESRGISTVNADHLAARLAGPFDRPTWLLTLSKGTSDARAAFRQFDGWPPNLSGWLDVSGIFAGTPIADWWTEETVKRWLMRALFGVSNLPFGTLLEMRRDAAIWREPVRPPHADRLIHVLGFPPPGRVEPRMTRNYRRLYATHGPNDGFTPLADAFAYPGRLFPVWGADHLMRLPDLSQLIYRIIHLAAAIEAGRVPPQS